MVFRKQKLVYMERAKRELLANTFIKEVFLMPDGLEKILLAFIRAIFCDQELDDDDDLDDDPDGGHNDNDYLRSQLSDKDRN